MRLSPILTVKNLVISTSNESKKVTLVDNLSFELLPSEILSIVGESGSGKSITAKSILGLLPKNFSVSGEIKYYEKNLIQTDEKAMLSVRGHEIGIVFQENYFFDQFDLETNIIFPLILKKEKRNDISQALKELLPWLSLEKVIKEKVYNLSIAELKLGQFARAIIGRPRILLLDRFFEDIDKGIQRKINYLILALKKIGTTVIVFNGLEDNVSINFNKKYIIYNESLQER